MQALSNRYPASQRGLSPVRQSKPRPLLKPLPKPDNDNTPGQRKPRPVPANDNRPGRPKMPLRGSSAARLIARRSIYGLIALGVAEGLRDAIAPWFYTNLQAAFLGGWKLDFSCKSGNAQWLFLNATGCTKRQSGLAGNIEPSPAELQARFAPTVINHMTQMFGPYTSLGAQVWDVAVNYSRTGSESLPDFDDVPWPEYLPLPNPEVWPVGVPYPIRAPAVRPSPIPASSGNSTRDSSSPGTRYQKETAFDPFPRRPRKGEKEKKIRGDQLYAIFGRGLSTYSEFGDFIDSIWDALDPYYQTNRYGEFRYRGRRTPHLGEKFNDLYHNLDRVDWTQAAKNLIMNEIEDQIVGRLIGRTTKVFGPNLGNALISGARIGF